MLMSSLKMSMAILCACTISESIADILADINILAGIIVTH